jgi:hypothetical protein
MIACPGCGLPREEEQVGAVPCPVCDAAPAALATARPATAKAAAPDPTAGLPSDVSQLHAATAVASSSGGFFGWAVVFLLGAGAGVGGLLGWQAAFPPDGPKRDPDPDTAQAADPGPKPHAGIAQAPMPRELAPRKVEPTPDPTPEPPPVPKFIPPPEHAVIVPLDDPAAVYTVPFLKKGERFVLRGKVKTLRVKGLDAGAILDASALQTQDISVSGKIDGRSTLRVSSPDGTVMFNAAIAGKSSITIDAPRGHVRFDSAIDGGSGITINARSVDLRGDVNGIETRVAVTIPGTGSLKVAAVRGIATVEYRVAGKGTPEVTAGTVSPTATFRKID